jgi:hypothetical protein
VKPAGADDDAEPGRREAGVDPAGSLPPADLPVAVDCAGQDRDADPAALEVHLLVCATSGRPCADWSGFRGCRFCDGPKTTARVGLIVTGVSENLAATAGSGLT